MKDSPFLTIIGGSGVYQFPALKNIETFEVDTPYGKPSSPVVIGVLHGKKVAFLARHGIGHVLSPTEVNYRANIYALKKLGARRVVSISACGSLREDYEPGHFVIPNQLFDFTKLRTSSFFGEGMVAHIGSADPYCDDLRKDVVEAVKQTGTTVHDAGVYITIEGPRFSTKAESNLFREWGMSIIGMTASPEAFLAREAGMCYATMAHVTDYDSWHETEEAVTVEMVVNTLKKNTALAQRSLARLVDILSADEGHTEECGCDEALKNAFITNRGYMDAAMKDKLSLLVGKYLG